MKKSLIYVVVLVVVALGAGVLIGLGAARKTGDRFREVMRDKRAGMGDKLRDTNERKEILQRISQRLKLSDDQRDKIKSILEATRQQVGDLKKEGQDKIRDLREKTDAQIKRLLSPEQAEEFERMIQEFKQKLNQRRPGVAPLEGQHPGMPGEGPGRE